MACSWSRRRLFLEPGAFAVKVPDKSPYVIQVVDDVNKDGLPSQGERMGMREDGPVYVDGTLEGVELTVGVFPQKEPVSGLGVVPSPPAPGEEGMQMAFKAKGRQAEGAPTPPVEGGVLEGAHHQRLAPRPPMRLQQKFPPAAEPEKTPDPCRRIVSSQEGIRFWLLSLMPGFSGRPIWQGPASELIGAGPDVVSTVWGMWWFQKEFAALSSTHSTLANYPNGVIGVVLAPSAALSWAWLEPIVGEAQAIRLAVSSKYGGFLQGWWPLLSSSRTISGLL